MFAKACSGLVRRSLVAIVVLVMAGLSAPGAARGDQQVTVTRVPAGADRPSGNLYKGSPPALSADGQILAFWSSAESLVAGDTNRASDVFVLDRASNALERASVGPNGLQANGPSQNAALSADGRFVAFESRATNLVAGDSNSSSDIFVRDRQTGTVERVSIAQDGSQGNGGSYRPVLSADGRFVAFWSEASTLVPNDENSSYDNGGYDIFLKDRQSGAIERVNVTAGGEEALADSIAPALTPDGRFVVFGSYAGNLIADDTNGVPDILLKDRQTGALERVSLTANRQESNGDSFWNPTLSADGRSVAFWSEASNLVPGDTNGAVDVFVKDRQSGAVERISTAPDGTPANGPSYNPTLSADGRYVAFWSEASNLVADDSNGVADVFLKDREGGALERLNPGVEGGAAGASLNPAISADGRVVAFWSEAASPASGTAPRKLDIIVFDWGAVRTR